MRALLISNNIKLSKEILKICKDIKYFADFVENLKDAVYYSDIRIYDIIIFDLSISDETKIRDFYFDIKRHISSTGIILIGKSKNKEEEIKFLKFWGNDYIKDFHPEILKLRIQNLIKYINEPSNFKTKREFSFNENTKEVSYKSESLKLTNREFKIFKLLENSRKLFNCEKLKDCFIKEPEFSSDLTIKRNIRNIRNKLKLKFNIDFIETVKRLGYKYNN